MQYYKIEAEYAEYKQKLDHNATYHEFDTRHELISSYSYSLRKMYVFSSWNNFWIRLDVFALDEIEEVLLMS